MAVAFFGDGTANQAYFHECINFAKVMSLPVVYVCENNQYGEYTPTGQVTPGGILARRRYTYQWSSLLVLAYFAEGVTRAWSDAGLSQKLALAEAVLSLLFFAVVVTYARLTRAAA